MKAELDAAKIWEENWGPLFAPDEPHNYEDRIKKLEEEAAKCVSRGSGGRGGRRRVCEGREAGRGAFLGARVTAAALGSRFFSLPHTRPLFLSLARRARARRIKGGRLLPQSAAYGGSGPAFREFEPRRSKGMKMKMAIAAKTGEDAANCTARAK